MDFTPFDKRRYPVVGAATGYGEWAPSYEETVATSLDVPLLAGLKSIDWPAINLAADLACGTGRTGAGLKANGVVAVDGVDVTPEMLELARAKGIFRALVISD